MDGSDSHKPFGPAAFYEPVQRFFGDKLDDICAAKQAAWIEDDVLSEYERKGLTPDVIAARLTRYIEGLGRLGKTDRVEHVQWIQADVLGDASLDDITRRDMLVQRALDIGGYRILKQLANEPVSRRARIRRAAQRARGAGPRRGAE
jgi:hypothetical protein